MFSLFFRCTPEEASNANRAIFFLALRDDGENDGCEPDAVDDER